jgi:hypothetical protein
LYDEWRGSCRQGNIDLGCVVWARTGTGTGTGTWTMVRTATGRVVRTGTKTGRETEPGTGTGTGKGGGAAVFSSEEQRRGVDSGRQWRYIVGSRGE